MRGLQGRISSTLMRACSGQLLGRGGESFADERPRQRRTERVGGLARRAKGQALGLEIGVLHRQRQDLVVEPAVFLEAALERLRARAISSR